MPKFYLVDVNYKAIIDLAAIGVDTTSMDTIIRSPRTGAAMLAYANNMAGTLPGDLRNHCLWNDYNRRGYFKIVSDDQPANSVLPPRWRPETTFGQLVHAVHPGWMTGKAIADYVLFDEDTFASDMTEPVLGVLEAATGEIASSTRKMPLSGLPILSEDDIASGRQAVITIDGNFRILASQWPDIEAPTLAGCIRSRTLCQAMSLMISDYRSVIGGIAKNKEISVTHNSPWVTNDITTRAYEAVQAFLT